jgi:hypothetical protein
MNPAFRGAASLLLRFFFLGFFLGFFFLGLGFCLLLYLRFCLFSSFFGASAATAATLTEAKAAAIIIDSNLLICIPFIEVDLNQFDWPTWPASPNNASCGA